MLEATVCVEGRTLKGLYNIDTGSGVGIDITAEATKQFLLEACSRQKRTASGLQMGVGQEEAYTWKEMLADSMHIGPFRLDSLAISYHPEGKGAFGKNNFIGNIGADVLTQFNVVIDIPGKKLYLKRYNNTLPENRESHDFGWLNRTDICDGWIVRFMYVGEDAEKAGICLGDTILTVNGRAVKDITWKEERDLSTPTYQLTLRGKNGKLKNAELRARRHWD